jgi:hypothetical protein
MTCVLCLFVNPTVCQHCLRCRRAVSPSAAAADDDDRVSFDPVLQLLTDSDSLEYQPTELVHTLDIADDPTTGVHFPVEREPFSGASGFTPAAPGRPG